MIRLGLFFLAILFLISCNEEKSFDDYPQGDFFEVQGMVYEKEEIKHFFREPTWNVKYLFKIDNKIYKGEKEKINVPILSGQPLIIYVNKNNPELNFFKKIKF